MRARLNRNVPGYKKLWLVPILIVILIIGLIGIHYLEKKDDQKLTADLEDEAVQRLNLDFNGNTYYYRDDLATYLIMGTDETTETASLVEGEDNLNNRQADFIMLMTVDHKDKSYTAVHINRDTFMEIRRLDENGNPDGMVMTHLDNAHSFGSGGKDSCRNVSEAVSRLLFGIPIDHYLSITMDGIPVLADCVDGVPVVLEEDLTAANPSYTEGAKITLKGQEALRFVRMRMHISDGTNFSRMSRQRTFIISLYEKIKDKLAKDDGFAFKFADALSPYVISDMTTDALAGLADQLQDYRFVSIEDLPGEGRYNEVSGYNDFIVDTEVLKEHVIRLFFRLG